MDGRARCVQTRGRKVHIIIISRLTGRGYNDVVGPPHVDPRKLNPQVHWIITLLLWINAGDYKDTYHLSGGLLCRVARSVGHGVYKERVISNNDGILYLLRYPFRMLSKN